MSSEQKKFAPELMGGASLLDRIRNALSSILDIGKSARIRLSRITKPDYDVIKEILDNRDSILGHRFVAKEQKRAPPRDINMDKVNKVIEELKNVPNPVKPDTPDPKSKEGDPNLIVYEPPVQVDTTVPVEGPVKKGEIKPDVDVDTDVPVQEEVKESTGAVDENVTDGHEDGVSVTMSESVKDDAKEFDDVHSLELIDNVLSIEGHDKTLEQTSLFAYGTEAESSPKFPECTHSSRQTKLNVEIVATGTKVEDVKKPWYTDEILIGYGVRAATDDCIETIIPLMEQFDEPVIEDEVIDEVDVEFMDAVVKDMTDHAVNSVVARIAEAAKVAESISSEIEEPMVAESEAVASVDSEDVIQVAVETDVPAEHIVDNGDVVSQIVEAAKVAESISSEVEEPMVAESEAVASVDSEDVVQVAVETDVPAEHIADNGDVVSQIVEAAKVAESISSEIDEPEVSEAHVESTERKGGVAVSFRFGSGAASGSSVGIRFRFGTASQ